MCGEQASLDTVLDAVYDLGYDGIDRTEAFPNEASGQVLLPEQHRRDPPEGLRRFLPRVYCDAGSPDLVPDDLRAAVEEYGWTVQAMGRDGQVNGCHLKERCVVGGRLRPSDLPILLYHQRTPVAALMFRIQQFVLGGFRANNGPV